ncbi:MAG: Gfo/Idh/MocA family oxidoreductase [Verrucomicrobiota bacterium]|nr:Gfo/Idh/MocA family oxidoreductase [Limisphaera sp.]MDW8381751.1 Gfo/Idh/MocA family oxidoreductase [Verrucomicrobiota bacterium]
MQTRRTFLKQSLLATASLATWSGCQTVPHRPRSRVLGANETICVGVVGFGGRGQDHIKAFRSLPNVRVTALCDADRAILDREVRRFQDRGEVVEAYTDLRTLLEKARVDVVSIATPNHWHALAAIWAVQAGKDVYVEKPGSHNVFEGHQLVQAARKYGAIVQVGTQCRSSQGLREAIEWIQSGQLGPIIRVRGLCYKRRESIGRTYGPQPIPASVDYDLWLGPAPLKPLRRARLHYDWHWIWDTGNGDLGNQGVHQMDIARWILGRQELAPTVWAVGGRLGYLDDGETPNTLIVFHDYKPAPLLFEVRGLPEKAGSNRMDDYSGASIGVVVDCEGGRMVIPSYTRAIVYDRNGREIRVFDGGGNHYANFIEAVRARRPDRLHADAQEGHLSAALCHVANISYRLGTTGTPEAIRDALHHQAEMAEMFARMYEHLRANQADFQLTPLVVGRLLRIHPGRKTFIGDRQANMMLTREYREPFVVPRRV